MLGCYRGNGCFRPPDNSRRSSPDPHRDRVAGPASRVFILTKPYTLSFNSLAGRKAIFLLALIFIVSPVTGFRPMRAGRARTCRMPRSVSQNLIAVPEMLSSYCQRRRGSARNRRRASPGSIAEGATSRPCRRMAAISDLAVSRSAGCLRAAWVACAEAGVVMVGVVVTLGIAGWWTPATRRRIRTTDRRCSVRRIASPRRRTPVPVTAGPGSDRRGWPIVRIPTQAGHVFRFDGGHRSDLIAATIPI